MSGLQFIHHLTVLVFLVGFVVVKSGVCIAAFIELLLLLLQCFNLCKMLDHDATVMLTKLL